MSLRTTFSTVSLTFVTNGTVWIFWKVDPNIVSTSFTANEMVDFFPVAPQTGVFVPF